MTPSRQSRTVVVGTIYARTVGRRRFPNQARSRRRANTGGLYAGAVAEAARNAERVRDFLRAHKTDGVGEGLGLAKLEELLQRAQVLAAQQRVG